MEGYPSLTKKIVNSPLRGKAHSLPEPFICSDPDRGVVPKFHVCMRSQQDLVPDMEHSTKPCDSPPLSLANEGVFKNPEASTHEDSFGRTQTPNSGEKTITELRQRFEKSSPNQEHNQSRRGESSSRDHRPIMSAFVPVESSAVGQDFGAVASVDDYILPALTFNPTSDLPVEHTQSSRGTENSSSLIELEVLESKVDGVQHPGSPIGFSTAESSSRFNIGEENLAKSSMSNAGWACQKFATVQDGISIIDFAYLHAAPSPMLSPMFDTERVHFGSRTKFASSIHNKLKSNDSNTSTQGPVDFDKRESKSVTGNVGSRAEGVNNTQGSIDGTLLLLPATVYSPPGQIEKLDNTHSSDKEDLLLLPASVYTPPSAVDRDVAHVVDEAPMHLFLPATVYTPPDPEVDDISQDAAFHSLDRTSNQECE